VNCGLISKRKGKGLLWTWNLDDEVRKFIIMHTVFLV